MLLRDTASKRDFDEMSLLKHTFLVARLGPYFSNKFLPWAPLANLAQSGPPLRGPDLAPNINIGAQLCMDVSANTTNLDLRGSTLYGCLS